MGKQQNIGKAIRTCVRKGKEDMSRVVERLSKLVERTDGIDNKVDKLAEMF